MRSELDSESYGNNAKRHLKQQSSILAHADRLGLLDLGKTGNVCYIEFGAGRARLSYWLAKAVDEISAVEPVTTSNATSTISNKVSYLLIERSGQRYKFENKLESSSPSCAQFQRIRCAIEHVDLRLVDCVRHSTSCVAFCKHLCGSGTDAALRCLVNASETSDCSTEAVQISAALLAPCCHHRCDWRTFTGRNTLSDLGLSESDFNALTSMTSWATCGLVDSDDDNMRIDRRTIGKRCKLLLDYARAKYLEETGRFEVKLCYYVPEDVTPENVMIIVTAKKTVQS